MENGSIRSMNYMVYPGIPTNIGDLPWLRQTTSRKWDEIRIP